MNLSRHYVFIIRNFLNYLPSRILVILNALLIIPFFAHILSKSEMSTYNLCVGLLALTCTATSDWIAKSALRFYEKYKLQDRLGEFYSNLFIISIFSYFLIAIVYFIFSDFISDKLYISKSLLFITLLIIFPAGLRQFLYQMLRVFNKPFLYTSSIVLYQVSLLLLFLFISGFIPKTQALLIAMAASISLVDIFILTKISLKIHTKPKLDIDFLVESLKYSLPTIVTNICLWNMINLNRYIFQYNKDIVSAAVTSVVDLFASATVTQIVSTFYFAMFPIIVQKYEKKQDDIKDFVTKTMQLYVLLFLPIIGVFIYYPDIVSRVVFAGSYNDAKYFLPFCTLSIFIHELLKFVNMKYHLSKKTCIEMVNAIIAGVLSVILNICFIKMWGIVGSGVAMLSSFVVWVILNLSYKIKEVDNFDFSRMFKVVVYAVLIGLFSSFIVNILLPYGIERVESLFKVPLFVLVAYWFTWILRFRILQK